MSQFGLNSHKKCRYWPLEHEDCVDLHREDSSIFFAKIYISIDNSENPMLGAKILSPSRAFVLTSIVALFVFCGSMGYATTHTINFGGNLGNTYSPSSLNMNVGDTIMWVGSFEFHPLRLFAVPSGADSFGPISSGTSFSYVVRVAGEYAYQCDAHFDQGMTGSMNASPSAVGGAEQANAVRFEQNFPNPVQSVTTMHFTLPSDQIVSLKVYNVLGDEVATVTNGRTQAGEHEVKFDASQLPAGHYFLRLEAHATGASPIVITREMTKLSH
jgi:plastocyanin